MTNARLRREPRSRLMTSLVARLELPPNPQTPEVGPFPVLLGILYLVPVNTPDLAACSPQPCFVRRRSNGRIIMRRLTGGRDRADGAERLYASNGEAENGLVCEDGLRRKVRFFTEIARLLQGPSHLIAVESILAVYLIMCAFEVFSTCEPRVPSLLCSCDRPLDAVELGDDA